MKTELDIIKYKEAVKEQIKTEIKRESRYGVTVGKTILATLMWVLEENTLDLNRLEEIYDMENN
jgi:hypothetical protein